jgi:hypothetical protein
MQVIYPNFNVIFCFFSYKILKCMIAGENKLNYWFFFLVYVELTLNYIYKFDWSMRLEIFSYDFFIYIFYERMIYFIDVKLINYNSMDISISF